MGWERDYVMWVQRSLNRLLELVMIVDGNDTNRNYRRAVERFNKTFVNKTLDAGIDDVGVVTQDALIRENENDFNYMTWVQIQLIVLGYVNLAPTNGMKDIKTRNAIKDFQKSHKLKRDGFIGFKTETALINDTRQPPPGDIRN